MPVNFEDRQVEARYYEDTRYLFLWDWEMASVKGEESRLRLWRFGKFGRGKGCLKNQAGKESRAHLTLPDSNAIPS